jgi:hypothetical protein
MLLPASPTAATTTSSTATEASASRSHAGGATATAGAGVRSVVSPGAASEGIPASAAAAREIPASDAIPSASARPVAKASATGPIAYASSSGAVAGQIAALSAQLVPSTTLAFGKRITAGRAPKSVRRRPVPIRSSAAMFRVVLPPIACIATASR